MITEPLIVTPVASLPMFTADEPLPFAMFTWPVLAPPLIVVVLFVLLLISVVPISVSACAPLPIDVVLAAVVLIVVLPSTSVVPATFTPLLELPTLTVDAPLPLAMSTVPVFAPVLMFVLLLAPTLPFVVPVILSVAAESEIVFVLPFSTAIVFAPP